MKRISLAKLYRMVLWATTITIILAVLSQGASAQQSQPAPAQKNSAEDAFKEGLAAFQRGDYKAAIESFDIAIKLNNTFSEAYYYRGLVYEEVPWIESTKSFDDYTSAIKFNPQHADSYFRRAMTRGDNEQEKIDDLNAAIRIKPDFADAYCERALATLHRELEEPEKAVEEFTKVIAICPDNVEVYYRRGRAHLKLKNDKKANEDFTEVIRLRPEDFKGYDKRVVARFNLGEYEGALKDYIGGLNLNPRGLLKWERNEVDAARFSLENFDQIVPNLPETIREKLANTYYERALARHYDLRRRDEDTKTTVAELTKSLALHPTHVGARYQRGLAHSEMGLPAEASKDFDEVIRLEPQNAEAYYSRGLSLDQLGNKQGAIDDLSRSVELNPEFAKAYYERGRVYSALGDQRRAIEDFTRAIAIYSEFFEGYYRRGLSHQSLGQKQKAIADYLQLVHLAVPHEKVERIETKLTSNLASIYYRGLARIHLALRSGETDWFISDLATELAKRDYLELAAKDFTLVISARPQFADAYYQRGRVRLTIRVTEATGGSVSFGSDAEGALADFNRAIRLNPSFAEAYFARGEYYESALKPREAILDFARVIKISPGNARAYYLLGELYSENYEDRQWGRIIQIPSKPELALNNYSLAIKADPSYVDAYFRRAYLLEGRNASQAIADLTQIIRLDPENVNAYRLRARIRKGLNDDRGALEDFTRAIDLDPSEPGSNNHMVAFTYLGRAYLRYKLGDGKGAKDDYLQALLIKPCLDCTSGSSSVAQANKADAFFQRGLALLRRGDKQGSRQNLEQAARLFYAQGDMAKYQNAKYQLSQF